MKRKLAGSLKECVGETLEFYCSDTFEHEMLLCFSGGRYVKVVTDGEYGPYIDSRAADWRDYSRENAIKASLITQDELDERERARIEEQKKREREQQLSDWASYELLCKKFGQPVPPRPEHLL